MAGGSLAEGNDSHQHGTMRPRLRRGIIRSLALFAYTATRVRNYKEVGYARV
jgi:hypothetical protein